MIPTLAHDSRGDTPRHATNHLVRAAITAPSLHNSQPWLFFGDTARIDLLTDPSLPSGSPTRTAGSR
ncbi:MULTISPECIES: hypothetical protein [unclassified Streptomyces]|uniref:hypothetical protein n=1 Tax=unclassified Streptomyces TaxID=2593676 RepID=UPI002E19BB91|nr:MULTISPECIES: hypothetical protein [unclassified Streptomyces]